MMKLEIKQEMGHYVMYINGVFYGSYDTFGEAAREFDENVAGTEVA